jgi:hypothetical protein
MKRTVNEPEILLAATVEAFDIDPNVLAPVDVIAPDPIVPIVAMFLLPSNTTALFAAAVPLVIPSNFSKSTSFISAEPIINELPAVMAASAVTAPAVLTVTPDPPEPPPTCKVFNSASDPDTITFFHVAIRFLL